MPRTPPFLLYTVAWILFGAVYVALFMASGASLRDAVGGALATVLPFGLLGILVLSLPRVLPWREERRVSFFVAQLGLTAAYAALGTAGWIACRALDLLLTTGGAQFRASLPYAGWQAVIGSLTYLSITGISYARENAERVRQEAERRARSDALRARAELAVLRSQLNPHFLLNTLHASIGLVRRDPALAERALERLGELLHYGLRMHRDSLDQVTLGEEWEFVQSYLEIESLRLRDRLQLDLKADPDVMPCLVPPFVLQPLVENAILHAIAPRKAGGRLEVTARRCGDRLQLVVCDDGPGVPASNDSTGTSLGLPLLRERLAMLYQGTARLSLEPATGGRGLRATVDLPADSEGASESSTRAQRERSESRSESRGGGAPRH